MGFGDGEGRRLGGALGWVCCEVKNGETGETGEVGDGMDGGTKRNAGTCGELVGAEETLVLRNEERSAFGREKLVVKVRRSAGAREETADAEFFTVSVEISILAGS